MTEQRMQQRMHVICDSTRYNAAFHQTYQQQIKDAKASSWRSPAGTASSSWDKDGASSWDTWGGQDNIRPSDSLSQAGSDGITSEQISQIPDMVYQALQQLIADHREKVGKGGGKGGGRQQQLGQWDNIQRAPAKKLRLTGGSEVPTLKLTGQDDDSVETIEVPISKLKILQDSICFYRFGIPNI